MTLTSQQLRQALGETAEINKKGQDALLSKLDEIEAKKGLDKQTHKEDKKTSQQAILGQIQAVEKAVQDKETPTDISINNPQDITTDIVAGLMAIVATIKAEVGRLDTDPVINNDFGRLEEIMTSNDSQEHIVSALISVEKAIFASAIDKEQFTDYTQLLNSILNKIETPDNSDILKALEDLINKEFKLPDVIAVDLDPNLIEDGFIKTRQDPKQVDAMSKMISGGGIKSVRIENADGKTVDVQHPLPTNGDSVYFKDIDVANSDNGGFTGVVTDYFDSLKSVNTDASATNPKSIKIWFNRSIQVQSVGFGCDDLSGNGFSNIVIKALGSGEAVRYTKDLSSDSTKRWSYLVELPPLAANGFLIEFHTTDEVCLSNLIIFKATDVNSRLKAVSDLSGDVESVTSFRGALNVTDPLVHKLGVNEYFSRELGTNTTLAIAASVGDTSITVVDSTGFIVGSKIRITQNGTAEVGIISITAVVANLITIDRPLANSFIIGTNVKLVENNMTSAIGTLASPISYRVTPPAGQIWQITRILISMTDGSGSMDDDKFGSLPALTNGSVGRAETIGGRTVNITNWKANRDLVSDMYDVSYPARTPAGTYALRGRWTFTNAQFIVELNGDEGHFIEVLIQDDLTAMDNTTVKAQGRIFGG